VLKNFRRRCAVEIFLTIRATTLGHDCPARLIIAPVATLHAFSFFITRPEIKLEEF
jgi:hypothetical protein